MDVPATTAFQFRKKRLFWTKSALLAATTVALIPILLWKHELAAALYVAFLALVHLVGLVVFAVGVKRHDIAPTRHGLLIRIVGLGVAVVLLYMVSKGLQTATQGALFWGSLFSIWAIHTGALTLLHIRGREEAKACPFA